MGAPGELCVHVRVMHIHTHQAGGTNFSKHHTRISSRAYLADELAILVTHSPLLVHLKPPGLRSIKGNRCMFSKAQPGRMGDARRQSGKQAARHDAARRQPAPCVRARDPASPHRGCVALIAHTLGRAVGVQRVLGLARVHAHCTPNSPFLSPFLSIPLILGHGRRPNKCQLNN